MKGDGSAGFVFGGVAVVILLLYVINVGLPKLSVSNDQKEVGNLAVKDTPVVMVTNAVKAVITNSEPVIIPNVKEEMLPTRNTNMSVAVFTADKSKLKKHLQKKLAEEQNKNVN